MNDVGLFGSSPSTSSPYRCSDDVWLTQRRATLALARDLAAPTLPALTRATVVSVTRLMAGAVGIAGTLVVAAVCATDQRPHVTHALLGTVGAAFAIVATGRVVATVAAGRAHALPALPALTGSSPVDREALVTRDPFAALGARVERLRLLRGPSVSLPLIAMSLLGPLTLHFPFAATADVSASDFGQWIQASAMIVGLAHLSLVALSLRYARRLLAAEESGVPLTFHREWGYALGMTVLASCVPGVVLFAIPPILTAVTGLVLVPAMFSWAQAVVRDEVGAIAAARAALPLGDDGERGERGEPAMPVLLAAPSEPTPAAPSEARATLAT